jgi:3-hydroxybutyryl-CoA dehydrogenase
MRILIVGPEWRLEECRSKFGDAHDYLHSLTHAGVARVGQSEVVFDFMVDEAQEQINVYPAGSKVFLNTIYITLKEVLNNRQNKNAIFFGFNGMPTFVDRSCLEICLADATHENELKKICTQLNTDFEVVEDRIGMVTPRAICMIINEAYLTHEEGTATREDIDKAMKLGTNYPYGPFEWGKRIGVNEVYRLLVALYKTFGDSRYQISKLLEKEATERLSK